MGRGAAPHRAAYAAALQGLTHQEGQARGRAGLAFMRDFQWWSFLDLASQEAEHLGDDERAHVIALLETAPCPGGVYAAWCLWRFAEWRRRAGDIDGSVAFARRAVLADDSWPYGHIYLGWLGLVSGRFDPLPHLREALRVDTSSAETIRAFHAFVETPGLMAALGI